ncbi:hypothetical protein T265_11135 [Opisthorchis viverrini]|uniref:Uncharacterized protein n=1 Tax=Opisthorchis viverrini TaxID=6198 RepID=A0A074ZAM2_OPIVI|nr:hypothetical protein T265_11135 [Opisthorchis viverrini]KER20270.1 hypothetical protein T265_11135 [Opisthorchis viverrini]
MRCTRPHGVSFATIFKISRYMYKRNTLLIVVRKPAESLACDVSRQLNALYQAAWCFICYDFQDIAIHALGTGAGQQQIPQIGEPADITHGDLDLQLHGERKKAFAAELFIGNCQLTSYRLLDKEAKLSFESYLQKLDMHLFLNGTS